MPWPTDSGTIADGMQGTTLFTDPNETHSLTHRQLGSVANSLVTTLGTSAGTNILLNIDAAGEFVPVVNSSNVFQDVMQGTFNTSTFGTPTLTNPTVSGGTLQSAIQNNGTVTGGQYNGGTLGTPTFQVWNFWVQANETPTVLGTTSAQGINIGTLTVAATASNKYDKGDKLNFTQGGTNMYMSVYSVPSGTTLLVTGGTDFVPGTSAITNFLYSKATNPNGFPDWFNWTSGVSFVGTAPTGVVANVAQFKVDGHECRFRFYASYGTQGTTTATNINQPIPSSVTGNIFHDVCVGQISGADYTSAPSTTPQESTLVGGTTIQMAYGANATKAVWIQGFYSI